jgi:hypothetical protein
MEEVVDLLCYKTHKKERGKYEDGKEDIGNRGKGEVDAKRGGICSG